MQDILMKLWTSADPDRIFKILTAAMTELEKTDQRQEYNADIFIDYISFIASEHLSGNRRQIEEGSWNEKAGLAENFMREHLPVTYISWLFSDNPVEEVFL